MRDVTGAIIAVVVAAADFHRLGTQLRKYFCEAAEAFGNYATLSRAEPTIAGRASEARTLLTSDIATCGNTDDFSAFVVAVDRLPRSRYPDLTAATEFAVEAMCSPRSTTNPVRRTILLVGRGERVVERSSPPPCPAEARATHGDLLIALAGEQQTGPRTDGFV